MTAISFDPTLVDLDLPFGGWLESSDDRFAGIDFPGELIIPRSEWIDRIDYLQENDPFTGPHPKGCLTAHYAGHVFDQNPESSCVYNATAGAIMRRRNMALGMEHAVVLSPMSGYCRVTRRRHSGSYMWGALELTRDEGLLPSNEHGQAAKFAHTFHENTPFVQREELPDGWQETAKHFVVTEWLAINSVEQFVSALLQQFPVVYGRSGHSIVGEDAVYDERKRIFCRACDSYGFNNRDGTGRIYDSERMMSTSGAWACRVTTLPDNPAKPGE